MVTIGADLHKRTHILVTIDAGGQRPASVTIAATIEGHAQGLR